VADGLTGLQQSKRAHHIAEQVVDDHVRWVRQRPGRQIRSLEKHRPPSTSSRFARPATPSAAAAAAAAAAAIMHPWPPTSGGKRLLRR